MQETDQSNLDVNRRPNNQAIDAKSIIIGGHPPASQNSTSANPPGIQLLNAMWRSPDLCHQLGTLDRQKRFKNLPANNVEVAFKKALNLSSKGTDVYFACAEYLTPHSREAANASGAYAFWMDIDCGEDKASAGKGYPIVEDAEDALRKFCKDAELPQPTHIVHSGGGLHAYWVVAWFRVIRGDRMR
jgi:hypothetical protein